MTKSIYNSKVNIYSVVNQKPRKVLRVHSAHLTDVLSATPNRVTSALYAKNLIPFEVKTNLLSITEDYKKASKLVLVLERQLQTHSDPDQYLHDICHVLRNQQHQTLTDIATSILKQLGQSSLHKQHSLLLLSFIPTGHSITDEDTSISLLDPDVQQYCDIMRDKYKHQPIVPTDWPPRVGQDFFGRLALLESQDRHADPETIQQTAWCMLRGNIDKLPRFTNNKIILIDIEDVLKPNKSGQSLTIVIDGPPGIGKTTLCRKLLNMWANGQIKHQQYDLVIYCSLRYDEIAQASTLRDLLMFIYKCREVNIVTEWFDRRHGEGLLIIFDGWDELSVDLRRHSLASRIIRKGQLDKCSVIVTSRSYASSSLLDLDTINRHVEVMGFTVQEIKNVVHGTLQMEPRLAEKLIQDLKVRGDVQSLCYIPLVCSIVILVYRKENGKLPTTLTQLYENFILQTIRRYVKKTQFTEPDKINSLHHLPSPVISTPFQEMCRFAYLSLNEKNPRMSFSLFQVQQFLDESVVKADYLGLMTTFTVHGEKSYQFLHLSIQEFLAAWWIAMYEKTEKVFNDHFNDDHFRMCLRFVSGLTHLEHEDYKQYFNKVIDLQCKRRPQFGFDACYHSRFQQHPEIQIRSFLESSHCSLDYFDKLDILLLQLLYESQNTTLCQVLAQSMKNHSLCLDGVRLSLFDILCLSYFLNNSNTSWNHLDLSLLNNQQVQILTNTLTNNSQQNQCKILEVMMFRVADDSVYKLLKPSFLHNIQECYCKLYEIPVDLCLVILQLLNLPIIKVLHLSTENLELKDDSTHSILHTDKYSELETCIAMNSTLLEMKLQLKNNDNRTVTQKTITSLINGVTRNKTITSFSLEVDHTSSPLSGGTIEHLLKENHTIQALKLNITDQVLPSSLNIVEVNTPLTTLDIVGPWWSSKLSTSLLPHIKGLHCIKLDYPYQPHLLFHSHPSLQQLDLQLYTSESAIELFTILQSNTTLKYLRVEIKIKPIIDSIGTSLQNMLKLNQTIEYLEIGTFLVNSISSTYLSFLTTGLSHNTSLQELSVFIPVLVTNNEQIRTFFNVISQKNHFTELKLDFTRDPTLNTMMKQKSLFYEQVLPLVTNMLKLHTTFRLLQISHPYSTTSPPIKWIEQTQQFLQSIFLHPSLEYITSWDAPLIEDTYKAQKKSLIEQHKKLYPLKPLPIIDFS